MTTRVTKGARLDLLLGLPRSFLASRGFAPRRSRAPPSINLKKKRDCSQSRPDRAWQTASARGLGECEGVLQLKKGEIFFLKSPPIGSDFFWSAKHLIHFSLYLGSADSRLP